MRAETLKNLLSEEDIIKLVSHLGGNPKKVGTHIECTTICHGSESRKLAYYDNKKIFTCFTQCSCSFDVIKLVEKVLHLEFWPALNFICNFFGIKQNEDEYIPTDTQDDFLKVFCQEKEARPELRTIDEEILNFYYPYYHRSWIQDNISIESMKHFGILYGILDHGIIIPHRNEDGALVGIRIRNLDKDLCEDGKKYMPARIGSTMYNHLTGVVLYGLYENLEEIKKYKKVVLVEAEKSVLQGFDYKNFPSIFVAVCGSSLSQFQINLLLSIGVEEIIIGFDKEFEKVGDLEEEIQIKKINKLIEKLDLIFNVSVLHDLDNLLNMKDSPTDRGEEKFLKLYSKRITL